MKKSIALVAAASAVMVSGAAHAGVHWFVGINVAPPVVYAPVYAPAPVYYAPPVVYRAPVAIYEPAPVYYGAPAYYGGGAVVYGAPGYSGGWYGHSRAWRHERWEHRHHR